MQHRYQQFLLQSRYSILPFLLMLMQVAAGQQLPRGTFILSTGFTNTQFTFKNNSKFEYKYTSCTGGKKGKGSYTFENKELTLNFDNPKRKYLPKSPTLERRPTQNDSSYLVFKFFDQRDSFATAGVAVTYKSKSNGKTYGIATREDGQANLVIENSQFPIDFNIEYILKDTKKIRLDSSGNYSIAFPLNFEYMQPFVRGTVCNLLLTILMMINWF